MHRVVNKVLVKCSRDAHPGTICHLVERKETHLFSAWSSSASGHPS